MHYIIATANLVYVFDSKLTVVAQEKLSFEDAFAISQGKISKIETKLAKTYADVQFCNYKKNISHVDIAIVSQLMDKIAHETKTIYRITKKKIQQSITWDVPLVQAIRSIEEIDKSINLLVKRLREWYDWQYPEAHLLSHEAYVKLLTTKSFKDVVKQIGVSTENSMGKPFEKRDNDAVLVLANQVAALYELRDQTAQYVQETMTMQLPNFTDIAGSQIGAKLLSLAGSAHRLAFLPSSTIQLLGAEKALFRHLKTNARPPKYGMLYQHAFVSRSRVKGKTARALANALAIAIKIDYFGNKQSISKKLLEKVKKCANID